ncbi:tetratricopeptide repeat protein [Desulfobulbus alkaliphilus]|uniref:tetratricopeptide repeat protein n=1 Tax=Desulfobulbus alkaliphilus TaxID=869814 RepID=UPI0019623B78|nr:tetratricopeptide repeat protein [Desulfobulbus alkaliphilus]MBM9537177.1 sel1 repeat family protein [Desulfobulbus alkaliphilus]
MQRLKRLLIFFCFLATCAIGHGQEIDETALRLTVEGYRYYYGVGGKPLNHARALRLYRQAAERGDAEAQFIVGGMLYRGQGGDPDRRNAFKWLLKAAEQGRTSPEALNIIGGSYLRGTYVPQNYIEAKKWLGLAAEQGHVGAKNDLAYILYNGLGGERDYQKALELYEQAALRGDVLAQANAGLMHATGTGTATDRARGYAWYSLAASRGNTIAAMYRNNLMLTMSWDELNQAQAIAVDLYRRIEQLESDPGERPAMGQP